MDQIFTAKNLLEKAWEYNVEIHQIFTDFMVPMTVYKQKYYIK